MRNIKNHIRQEHLSQKFRSKREPERVPDISTLSHTDGTIMRCPIYFPDRLEEFMNICNATEHWLTVEEFRETLSLDKSCALAISGFLRRLYNNPSLPGGRYTVVRIENVKINCPCRHIVRRYLVREKAVQRQGLVVTREKFTIQRRCGNTV
jgi:hypothetical protein